MIRTSTGAMVETGTISLLDFAKSLCLHQNCPYYGNPEGPIALDNSLWSIDDVPAWWYGISIDFVEMEVRK